MNRTVLLSDLTFHSYGSRTPSARAKVASQLFLLPRSHPSSAEEGSLREPGSASSNSIAAAGGCGSQESAKDAELHEVGDAVPRRLRAAAEEGIKGGLFHFGVQGRGGLDEYRPLYMAQRAFPGGMVCGCRAL